MGKEPKEAKAAAEIDVEFPQQILDSPESEGASREEAAWERDQPSALERHADVFAVLDEFVNLLCHWVHDDEFMNPEDPLNYFKLATGFRTVNLIRSIRLLLENDHWEDAAILVRTLFELLLNTEEVLRDESVATKRAKQFLRFGELQRYLDIKNNTDYEILRGVYNGDASEFKKLDEIALVIFKEFRKKGKKHRGKSKEYWATSWCGRTVSELCGRSSNAMRPHQYRIMYSFASNLVHAGPSSLLDLVNHGADFSAIKREVERRDEKRTKEFIFLTLSFAGELFHLIGGVFPRYDTGHFRAVFRKIYPFLGRVAPPDPSD